MTSDGQDRLEQIKFSNQLRIEEYKDRRAEINELIKDTRSLELYALTGIVVYYAWLLTHCLSQPHTAWIAWLIPVVLPVLVAWRSTENITGVVNVGKYVRKIEDDAVEFSGHAGAAEGWENYLSEIRKSKSSFAWRWSLAALRKIAPSRFSEEKMTELLELEHNGFACCYGSF